MTTSNEELGKLNITKCEVNWQQRALILTVTNKLSNEEQTRYRDALRYHSREVGRATLYYAKLGDRVSFYAHDPRNQTGFGGAQFVLRMHDDTTRVIIGPWSSREGVMNKYFPHCVGVSLIDGSGYHWAAHVTLECAQRAAKLARVTLIDDRKYLDDEIYYTPTNQE